MHLAIQALSLAQVTAKKPAKCNFQQRHYVIVRATNISERKCLSLAFSI